MSRPLADILADINLTAAEAWDFQTVDGSGNFPGLFVPSRVLTITGPATAPIQRVAGHRGMGVYQPDSASQWLRTPYNNSYNALENGLNWLAFSAWFKNGSAASVPALGISGAVGATQWYADCLSPEVALLNSADNGPAINPILTITTNVWHHMAGQVFYDGAGTGVNLALSIDGVDYPTITGSLAITPNFPATAFDVGTYFEFVSQDVTWDSLLLVKSAEDAAPFTASIIAELFNGGLGIDFVPSSNRRRKFRRAKGLGIIN